MRRSLLVLGLLLGLAAPAIAAEQGLTAQEAKAAHSWRGQFCTAVGCGPAPATTAASVIGFAGAALGAAWASRRRDPKSR
jgi:MYXO-CTERM domain-containing protein